MKINKIHIKLIKTEGEKKIVLMVFSVCVCEFSIGSTNVGPSLVLDPLCLLQFHILSMVNRDGFD